METTVEKILRNKRAEYRADWNKYAREILGVRLDRKQRKILKSIQYNSRTSARSGNARGKDFVAAVAAVTFLNLHNPSKIICTAPTGRQAVNIMMSEISSLYAKAKDKRFIGGTVLVNQIKFRKKDRFLLAFKAQDKTTEAWTGFHSSNLMVIVTEASGIAQETFDSIESILTGDSRFLMVYNPNQTTGETYRSVKSGRYHSFKLNCLNAPNVRAKKILISGQVDYPWVKDKVENWCEPIEEQDAKRENHDFKFEGQWYRPNDRFCVKVLGEFPLEGEDQLIPLRWVEAAVERWKERNNNGFVMGNKLRLGVDVAGEGRDATVFCYRYDNHVNQMRKFLKSDHMVTAGNVKNELGSLGGLAFIDTIGEGAGVHSRLNELNQNSVSAKFSHSAKMLRDVTGERTFNSMRAYCWWAIRDALNPEHEIDLALPPIPELVEDLTEPLFDVDSQGRIRLEKKEDIKERLKRSPDYGDSLALTYYPYSPFKVKPRVMNR